MRRKRRHACQDIVWRRVLSHRTALKELLRDFVPDAAPLVNFLDFDRARVVETTFSDALLAELESDVIWRVPTRNDRECIVYVHIEHQSTCERLMALRVLRYVGALYGAIVAERARKSRAPLPSILPVVLYSGARRWHAPLRFEELLVDLPAAIAPPVAARYCLVNVNAIDDAMLARAGNALAALFQLEKARLHDNPYNLEAVARSMAREPDGSLVEAVLIAGYNLIEAARGPEAAEPLRELLETDRAEDRPMPLPMADFLVKCGNHLLREQDRKEAMSALRRAFRCRGLNPDDYKKDIAAVKPFRKIVNLAVGVAVAKDPRAYLRRRFGH